MAKKILSKKLLVALMATVVCLGAFFGWATTQKSVAQASASVPQPTVAVQSVDLNEMLVDTLSSEDLMRGGSGDFVRSVHIHDGSIQDQYYTINFRVWIQWHGGVFDRNYIEKIESRGWTNANDKDPLPSNFSINGTVDKSGDEGVMVIRASRNGVESSVRRASVWYVPTNKSPEEKSVSGSDIYW
ncbi:MAG: hypothetical protein FWD76_04450 [Firmicutes bacterium]|nr:hypothetical protein [Bacillota bacterium]